MHFWGLCLKENFLNCLFPVASNTNYATERRHLFWLMILVYSHRAESGDSLLAGRVLAQHRASWPETPPGKC